MLTQRPIVVAACCLLAGFHFSAALDPKSAWLAAIGLALVLPWCTINGGCSRKQALLYALLLLSSVLYYQLRASHDNRALSEWFGNDEDINQQVKGQWEGIIITPPVRDGDRLQFQLAATGWHNTNKQSMEPFRATVLVHVKLSNMQELKVVHTWKRGARVLIQGQLTRPSDTGNFGGFSYRDYLHTLRIYWLLKVSNITDVHFKQKLSTGSDNEWLTQWNQLLSYLDGIRDRSARVLLQLYNAPHGGYILGLVLGIDEVMDPDTYQQFSQLGLTHLLAISGLHVGVLIAALFACFRMLRLTKEVSISITLAFIPLYVLWTGASASVIRASLMAALALYGAKRGWLKDGLHLLAAVFMIMVLWEPKYVLQAGFQLSFAVTAGLILFVPQAMQMLSFLPRSWASMLSVTFIAQAVSLPLTVYYFNQFSLLSLAANFVLVPLVSLGVLPLSSISLLVGAIYVPAAQPFALLVTWLNDVTFHIVGWLARIEGVTILWPTPPLWWIAVYYAALTLFITVLRRWLELKRISQPGRRILNSEHTQPLEYVPLSMETPRFRGWAVLAAAVLFGGVLCHGYQFGRSIDPMISFIDVGQGDSILITTSTGKHMLIDGGGTINFHRPKDRWRERKVPFEIGEKVVVPLLKQRGVHQLDAVLLTHADQDHAGGLQAVLKHIPVKQFIMNGTWKAGASMNALYQIAIEKEVPIRKWAAGQRWELDEWSSLHVLFPYDSPTLNAEDSALRLQHNQNQSSLVIELTFTHPISKERAVFMLTGDLEADGEQLMLQQHEQSARQSSYAIDVLKIAHHGSKTSTTPAWLHVWKPRVGVISVGRNNRYGHPHPQVLSTLHHAALPILRTDRDGEIQFKLTTNGLQVRTKRQSKS